MTKRRSLRARLWRLLLRLRYVLVQRHRHQRLVLEAGLGMPLLVLPEVFNPALFRTTAFVLDCLGEGLAGNRSRVLDLCTGTGVLALAAARHATRVVAVDINPEATRCARINTLLNRLEERIEVRQGDLFEAVADERFDLILANPPYYPGQARTPLEQAFRAGDLPQRLASGLGTHLEPDGEALIVLSSDGDERTFLDAFSDAGLSVNRLRSRDLISERVTLFQLRQDE